MAVAVNLRDGRKTRGLNGLSRDSNPLCTSMTEIQAHRNPSSTGTTIERPQQLSAPCPISHFVATHRPSKPRRCTGYRPILDAAKSFASDA
eukprot:CAMPEP_0119528830 /NCGR_PEP_ID=MMETSP1344-20130328/42931_1 /TAXON_ID=236787 /ORGANISM="Florenciella parvula, Strain CCMP2471" /LENGTH=90 /DNA_ID=CAMNT_0007568295 /DNA_START=129 /DNA_END=397 /DNA_ORIENTATION=-